jgi:hypothetical protein
VKEKLCFVQFIHPGGEHGEDEPGLKHWNRALHRRKFLRAPGRLVDETVARDAELAFWGEWEPDSRVTRLRDPIAEGPRFVHEPFLPRVGPEGWRQNTDPFVFGDEFHYTGCLQHTKQGHTQLRYLARGSVILFGSCLDRSKFVVDTVFVVDGHRDHGWEDYAEVRSEVSPAYAEATIDPWYSGGSRSEDTYRLYSGATFDSSVEGMFSFFPCRRAAEVPHGFPRAEVNLSDIVTPTMTQGKRLNPQPDVARVRDLWRRVVSHIQDQGLALGVYAQMPDKV